MTVTWRETLAAVAGFLALTAIAAMVSGGLPIAPYARWSIDHSEMRFFITGEIECNGVAVLELITRP